MKKLIVFAAIFISIVSTSLIKNSTKDLIKPMKFQSKAMNKAQADKAEKSSEILK